MNNYQAQMLRMNYLANTQLNINPYIPYYNFPYRDEDILSLVESYFSKKNLNKNLDMRLQIINDEGLIPIEYIININLEKINGIKITQEKLCNLIEKIGSDIVGIKTLDYKIYLYPKNYDSFKNTLVSIEELQKIKDEQIKKQQLFMQQQMMIQQSQMQVPFMGNMIHPMNMNMGMYYGPLIWPQQINFNNQINQMRNLEKKNDKV
jgi:hypothetical protein